MLEQFAIAGEQAPASVSLHGTGSLIGLAMVGGLVCWGLIHLIIRYCSRNRGAVRDGDFHHGPVGETVPRFGGVALAGAFIAVVLVHGWSHEWQCASQNSVVAIIVTSLAMFAVGFWDDIKPLGARKKLLLQIIVALGAFALGLQVNSLKNPFTGAVFQLESLSPVLTVIWLVAMTNLINLVDGIDGLAGGVSLMLMVLLAFVGSGGMAMHLIIATGMAGALVAFLRFNFPPARIYLGDGGAYFLGFLIGAMTIANSHKGTILAALIAPVIALGLPIIDTSLAIIRRGMMGLPLFRADRKHIHHRLMQRGLSRTKTVLLLYAISVAFLLVAFAMFWSEQRFTPMVFGLVFLLFLIALQGRAIGLDFLTIGRTIGNSREMRRHTRYVMALGCWLEMEADRCKTLDCLWEDFTFMSRKVGFTRAKVVLSEGHRVWQSDGHAALPPRAEHVFEFNVRGRMMVILQCNDPKFDDLLTSHLSELTAEAWLKAVKRFKHAGALSFAMEAPAVDETVRPEGASVQGAA